MKKIISIIMVIGLLLTLWACNEAGEDTGGGDDSTDVIFDWGEPGTRNTVGSSESYPGVMLALSGAVTMTGKLGDISEYGEIILDASLYASATDTEPVEQADSLGQFTLLSGSDWEVNRLFTPIYNMKVSGESSGVIPSAATGTPVNLLVQTTAGLGVNSIEVRKLTLKLKTDGVVLESVFGPSYVAVSGNKITFNNATYSDGAALYTFPAEDLPLTGKTITFTYKLENYNNTLEHQLHIQAANGVSEFNGQNPSGSNGNLGQKYITLEDENTFDEETGTGSFTVSGTDLENASKSNGATGNDYSGQFILTGVRIVNNGTVYTDAGVTHTRERSYTITFNSITVSR